MFLFIFFVVTFAFFVSKTCRWYYQEVQYHDTNKKVFLDCRGYRDSETWKLDSERSIKINKNKTAPNSTQFGRSVDFSFHFSSFSFSVCILTKKKTISEEDALSLSSDLAISPFFLVSSSSQPRKYRMEYVHSPVVVCVCSNECH